MNTLLDRMDWRCLVCGERPGCKCWVTLRCKCGRTTMDRRIPEYGDLDVIDTSCPLCQAAGT